MLKEKEMITKKTPLPEYALEEYVEYFKEHASTIRYKEQLDRDVTICIKTFLRPTCLSKLIKSIRKYYPTIQIIVGDDSFKECKEPKLWKGHPFSTDKNITYYKLPYDTKAAFGRNFIISKVETPFVFVTDDDHVFTDDTKIELLYKALVDVPYASMAAGTVGGGNNYTLSYFKVGDTLHSVKENLGEHNGYKSYMSLQTLYLARTKDIVANKGYNEKLHTGQHSEFNIRMFYSGLVQLHVPSVKCKHEHPQDSDHQVYNGMRKDRSLVNRYFEALGIKEVHELKAPPEPQSKFFSDPTTKANAYVCLALATSVFNRHSKNWYLCGGTLLGFKRGGDFIPHDCDIDVIFDNDDISMEMIDELLNMGLKLKYVFGSPEEGFEISLMYKNVKIDIITKYKFNDRQYYTIYWYRGYMIQHVHNNINETTVEYWNNIPVRVPVKWEEYLVNAYGDDWMTPRNTTSDPFSSRCVHVPNNLSKDQFRQEYKKHVKFKKDYYKDADTAYNHLRKILKWRH